MKKKKLIMTVLFTCLIALAVLSGCQFSGTLVDDNYRDDGLYKVTLFYNSGSSDGSYYHDRFIPQNARFPAPGAQSSPITNPIKPAHTIAGWYQVKNEFFKSRQTARTKIVVDEHGVSKVEQVYDQAHKPIIDTQYYIEGYDYMNGGNILGLIDLEDEQLNTIFAKTQKWNFEIDRVKSDIVLVPLWSSSREYVYITEADSLVKPTDNYFESRASGGNYDFTWFMNADGSIKKPNDFSSGSLPQLENYQIEGLYLDNRYINEIPFDAETGLYYPDDRSTDRFPVYVRYISDNYTIINSINDFNYVNYTSDTDYQYTFYPNPAGGYKGIYLRANIDLGGGVLNFRNASPVSSLNFSSEIRGNGYTISNFNVNITQRPATSFYGGIFGTINNANIQNITFSNFTVNFQRVASVANYLTQTVAINVIADDIPATATLKDVNVRDMRVIDLPVVGFDNYRFTYDGKNERIDLTQYPVFDEKGDEVKDEHGNIIYETPHYIFAKPGDFGTLLKSNMIADAAAWEVRAKLVMSGYGVNFESSVGRVVNCNADEPSTPDWQPDNTRQITSANYYRLPNLPSVDSEGTYKFYGWFTDEGYQYGPGRKAPAKDETLTVYAMFIKTN